MTSIDRSKYFFQLIEKNIISIDMSINRNLFFKPFTPFLANAIKNLRETQVFNQKVLRKPSLSLHRGNLRILATKIVWNM